MIRSSSSEGFVGPSTEDNLSPERLLRTAGESTQKRKPQRGAPLADAQRNIQASRSLFWVPAHGVPLLRTTNYLAFLFQLLS